VGPTLVAGGSQAGGCFSRFDLAGAGGVRRVGVGGLESAERERMDGMKARRRESLGRLRQDSSGGLERRWRRGRFGGQTLALCAHLVTCHGRGK
jgi:hypothetical protein